MIKALNTAATGMKAQQDNMDTISNNLANVNTTGFKKSRAEFEDLLYQTQLPSIKIAIVGKYTGLSDAYLSVVEALKHASCANNCHCDIQWILAGY